MGTTHQGALDPPGRALVYRGLLGPPLVPIFWYIVIFDLEKKSEEDFRNEAPPPRGGTWVGALLPSGGAILPGELPSRRGKSKLSSSPTPLLSLGGQSSSNLQRHHLLSNPSSSLVFNLCTETSDWYLWVTSSVDYLA